MKTEQQRATRGAVVLKVGETEHVLKFGTNAICKIQDELGKTLGSILEDLRDEAKLDMKTIRTMVQKALVVGPDQVVTPEEAGDLIDDVGLKEITKAFGAVFIDDTKEEGAKAGAPNP